MMAGAHDRGLFPHHAPLLGLTALVRKLPGLREAGGVSRAIVTVAGSYGAAYGQMRRLDRWGALGSMGSQALTFAAVSRFIWSALRSGPPYRERYGDLAYQEAAYRFFFPMAGAMVASVVHILTVPGRRSLPRLLAFVPGVYLLATGFLLWLRALRALGLDTAALVYVYFPEEGRQIQTSTYQVLRHPLYAGVARVLLGLTLLRGKVRGVALALLTLAWFHLVIRLEEAELVRRFGQSYEEYRERTPAILPDSLQTELRLLEALLG